MEHDLFSVAGTGDESMGYICAAPSNASPNLVSLRVGAQKSNWETSEDGSLLYKGVTRYKKIRHAYRSQVTPRSREIVSKGEP